MSRLIDADALIADMEKRYCKDCERRKGVKDGEVRMLYEIGEAPCRACGTMDAMDEIDNAPTIEALEKRNEPVAPVREVGSYSQIFRCRNCDTLMVFQKQKYCHECGQAVKWE